LPKLDPNIDLRAYLVSLEELPHPWDASALFGRTAELEVEVGSGKGMFLASAAGATVERDYLGTEISGKYARFAAARLARRALGNVKIIHGDARRLFADWLPACCAAAVHIYFPDPWWKKRHHKRRIMTADFLADVQRVLRRGGALHFWTDVRDYYDRSLRLIAAAGQLRGPALVPQRPAADDLDYQTHFERRMRLHNHPVYRAEFSRE
jgi:tRNA (guanine-N7-)-methyltransferase